MLVVEETLVRNGVRVVVLMLEVEVKDRDKYSWHVTLAWRRELGPSGLNVKCVILKLSAPSRSESQPPSIRRREQRQVSGCTP